MTVQVPYRADVINCQTTGVVQFNGAGTQYLIQANNGALYLVYVDTGSDIAFRKSTNGGLTWGTPTVVAATTATAVSVWYDRWTDSSGTLGDLIHIVYQESATDDTFYRTINTASSDALSTQTTIFLGASTLAGGCLSVTRSRGGNVYCATMIDAGTEGGFFRLTNANVPNGAWDAARTTVFEASTGDMVILTPGFAADNQDIMAIYWDASNNEISRKIYDDSANSWAETSISTGMTETQAAQNFPNFAISVDLTNSRTVLVAWNGVDTANADLLGWVVSESAITAFTTPVVLNSVDDQGLCGIAIDTATEDWYVVYGGKSDGSETFSTAINLYMKGSTDAGATWSPETKLTTGVWSCAWLITQMHFSSLLTPLSVAFHNNITLDELMSNASCVIARPSYMMGV